MTITRFVFAAIGLALAVSLAAQTSKSVYVPKAGTLAEMLTEAEADEITELTLKGKINAVDFRHLRDGFKRLQLLDISTATISMYTGKNGPCLNSLRVYQANAVPAYAFCKQTNDGTFTGKETLTRIILSDKTKNIETAAFKGCTNLKACQIRRSEAPRLQDDALADSVTAVFVPEGCSDYYRLEEKWENFAFVEGEPVSVSLEIGKAGSLASELVRKGIQPKEVNFLTVAGKMDVADFTLIRNYMHNLVAADLTDCDATEIPDYSFTQKKYLLSVTLPRGLQRIGQRAFSGCTRLAGTLVLPPEVTAIEYGAFLNCTRLRYVKATGNRITTLGDDLFGDGKGKLIQP